MLYFMTSENWENGAALAWEMRTPPEGYETVEGLVRLLLSGPEDDELISPFPRGTALRKWWMEDGVANIDLSEAYGGLSGADLSLADGCIVLTLCQIEGVKAVYIMVEGRPRPFRDQVLLPSDFLLDNGADGESETEVSLWFLRGDSLAQETRTLSLDMGDQAAIAALQALLEGPEGRDLQPICPAGTKLLYLDADGTCFTVDLSENWLKEEEEDPRRLYAIANTLAGLEPGAEVVFQVEGQRLKQFGGVDLTIPLQADLTLGEDSGEEIP